MTFDNCRGAFPFWKKIPLASRTHRRLKLLVMALVATWLALLLSPSATRVLARDQSPVSPMSPLPTQTQQPPTPSPTAPVIAPTPSPETPAPADDQLPQISERGTALLVAGGIVLTGLIVGAVVLLVRGQPPDEATP